jgi:hypothetical protein
LSLASRNARAIHAIRLAITVLSRWFDWRQALAIVQPQTLSPVPRQVIGIGFPSIYAW